MRASPNSWTFRRRLVLALLLVGSGAGGHWVLAREWGTGRTKGAGGLRQPLVGFPDRIGDWLGTDWPADPTVIADIKVDDHLQRRYAHPSGAMVVLWLSYSRRAADRYHYPTVCMRGAGWLENRAERRVLPASDDSPALLTFEFEREGGNQAIVYWYYILGADPLDRWLRSGSKWARGFLRGATSGGLTVEVFTQGEPVEPARLEEFARQVARELEAWLPDGTTSDCALGAAY